MTSPVQNPLTPLGTGVCAVLVTLLLAGWLLGAGPWVLVPGVLLALILGVGAVAQLLQGDE